MHVREATDSDLDAVLRVECDAFGHDKEAELVRHLMADPSAQPLLSLLAWVDEQAVGHVLFTRVRVGQAVNPAAILAPLAVVPDAQKQGVGTALVRAGLERLAGSGVELVFVLGHPGYYPRHGFAPAGVHGLEAPYPIPTEHADAWMVQALQPDVIGTVRGKIICADALNKAEYWRE